MTEYGDVEAETHEAVQEGFLASKEAWRDMAFDVIRRVAEVQPTLSVNDIRPEIDASKLKTQDKRALGGVMKSAQALGWIMPTGEFVRALNGHLRPQQLWRSRLYKYIPQTLRLL